MMRQLNEFLFVLLFMLVSPLALVIFLVKLAYIIGDVALDKTINYILHGEIDGTNFKEVDDDI